MIKLQLMNKLKLMFKLGLMIKLKLIIEHKFIIILNIKLKRLSGTIASEWTLC
jgi:hypothetical protein